MEVVLIDMFSVPKESLAEFLSKVRLSATHIRGVPGFVEGHIFEREDDDGSPNVVTMAVWKDQVAFENAKNVVATIFQTIGFSPPEIMSRLRVEMQRAVYRRSHYPGTAFFLAMSPLDPLIHRSRVPIEYLLTRLDIPALRRSFLTVMFITLLGSAGALVHAVNERIAAATELRGRRFSGSMRAVVAGLVMVSSVVVARRVGIVALVAKGYGALAWVFILVFIAPLLTFGVWKIMRDGEREAAALARPGYSPR